MLLTYAVIHVFNPLIRVESCRRLPLRNSVNVRFTVKNIL